MRDRDEVWDSGRVASSEQSYVAYRGPALGPGDLLRVGRAHLGRARRRLAHGPGPRTFDTGLGDRDWSGASWIRRVTTGNDFADDYTLARTEVAIGRSPVTRARAYVSALGQYELHVNGRSVYRGDSFGHPGEGQYSATDITREVRTGRPLAVGVLYHYWTCNCQGRANGRVSNTTLAAPASARRHRAEGRERAAVRRRRRSDGRHRLAGRDRPRHGGRDGRRDGHRADARPPARSRPPERQRRARVRPQGPVGPVGEDRRGSRRRQPRDDRHRRLMEGRQGRPVHQRAAYAAQRRRRRLAGALRRPPRDAGLERARLRRRRLAGPRGDRSAPAAARAAARHLLPPRPGRLRPLLRDRAPPAGGAAGRRHPGGRLRGRTARGAAGPDPRRRRRPDAEHAHELPAQQRAPDRARLGRGEHVAVDSAAGFSSGDPVTIDAPANGHGAGDPERRTVASASGTEIVLDAPLSRAHAAGAWVEGSRAGTSGLDTQGSNMGWFHTERAGAADRTRVHALGLALPADRRSRGPARRPRHLGGRAAQRGRARAARDVRQRRPRRSTPCST